MLSDQDGAALCLPLRDDAAQLIDRRGRDLMMVRLVVVPVGASRPLKRMLFLFLAAGSVNRCRSREMNHAEICGKFPNTLSNLVGRHEVFAAKGSSLATSSVKLRLGVLEH